MIWVLCILAVTVPVSAAFCYSFRCDTRRAIAQIEAEREQRLLTGGGS